MQRSEGRPFHLFGKGADEMNRRSLPFYPLLILAAAAGCSPNHGPITECVVSDSRGNAWTRSDDVSPLGAQDAALIACGQESPDPTSCVVTRCEGHW